ncbi:putative 1,4-beta-D-glucan cellobiohydrolase A [Venturia inaequalis]|nr:putative 1,4-beta-D-glucan cellobiohydrolase A [Venturia inaequalis]
MGSMTVDAVKKRRARKFDLQRLVARTLSREPGAGRSLTESYPLVDSTAESAYCTSINTNFRLTKMLSEIHRCKIPVAPVGVVGFCLTQSFSPTTTSTTFSFELGLCRCLPPLRVAIPSPKKITEMKSPCIAAIEEAG